MVRQRPPVLDDSLPQWRRELPTAADSGLPAWRRRRPLTRLQRARARQAQRAQQARQREQERVANNERALREHEAALAAIGAGLGGSPVAISQVRPPSLGILGRIASTVARLARDTVNVSRKAAQTTIGAPEPPTPIVRTVPQPRPGSAESRRRLENVAAAKACIREGRRLQFELKDHAPYKTGQLYRSIKVRTTHDGFIVSMYTYGLLHNYRRGRHTGWIDDVLARFTGEPEGRIVVTGIGYPKR